jgi:hypothetical protein
LINIIASLLLATQYKFCEDLYFNLTKKIPTEENLAVCSLLIEDSKNHKLDIPLVLGVAWEESRMTEQSKPTKYKCVGPLQIKYQFWCPNNKGNINAIKRDGLLSKCDLFYHGTRALKYYITKFKPLNKALCYYNNSKKCRGKKNYKSHYVKRVNKYTKKIRSIYKKYNI